MSLTKPKLLVLLCFVSLCASPLWPQDQVRPDYPPTENRQIEHPQTEHPRKSLQGQPMKLTGCLEKGDQASAYSITGGNGKEYGLKSTKVSLNEYVGQKVTVSGRPVDRAAKKKIGEPGAVDLEVSKLKIVNASCK